MTEKKTRYVRTPLERDDFMPYIIDVWKRKPHDYVSRYLRACAQVKPNDKIYEELMFLSNLKRTLEEMKNETINNETTVSVDG